MDVVLVVDMQEASVSGDDKHEIGAVAERINALTRRIRRQDGRVIFVQHDGTAAEGLEPFTPGWQVARRLEVAPEDLTVRKTLNDAFHGTSLERELRDLGATRVIVTGWATDFCVDAAVRAAVARGFDVVVASDCHTLNDRPHLAAPQVIVHHNWVWANLIAPATVRVTPSHDI